MPGRPASWPPAFIKQWPRLLGGKRRGHFRRGAGAGPLPSLRSTATLLQPRVYSVNPDLAREHTRQPPGRETCPGPTLGVPAGPGHPALKAAEGGYRPPAGSQEQDQNLNDHPG